VVLAVVAILYPIVADDLGRPLTVFVLPGLLTAVLGGWRPTLLIGLTSLGIAAIVGAAGPLGTAAYVTRLLVIALGIAMGAVGAAVRENQRSLLGDLDEAMALREAFQRALAPSPVPAAGLVVAARYRPAEEWMTFGGDFFEAVALDDGRMAVLIGDVCGHGPREAAYGAALRAGWKGIALSSEPDPARWVSDLDAAFFGDGRIDTFVTLCTGYLDRHEGTAHLVNAGHPPPLVLKGSTEVLDLPVTRPLGIGLPAEPMATKVPWSGEPMLFFTDGLIENPMKDGLPRRWGFEGLVQWLDDRSAQTLDELANCLMEAATASRELRDDLALLIVTSSGVGLQSNGRAMDIGEKERNRRDGGGAGEPQASAAPASAAPASGPAPRQPEPRSSSQPASRSATSLLAPSGSRK
jgi:serine phosphatase RsbU (regulator of sigma subunit)